MSDLPLRAADVLARTLFEAGCRHAFGMPGGEVLTLIDALERAGAAEADMLIAVDPFAVLD